MSAAANSIDGITGVDLAELIAMRARAGKPMRQAARVHAACVGEHRTALRGRGLDYAESRIYQPGDDVRNIDWRRTARSGKWHTKLFEEAREQDLLLLIDTHASMRFGTRVRYKSVAAARAAAWMVWTGVRGGDRVGAMSFGCVQAALAPQGGRRGALAVLGAIARWDAQAAGGMSDGDDSMAFALRRAQRQLAPGSRVLLVSDGWSSDAAAQVALVQLARRCDVRVGIVVDALESAPPAPGSYVFETDAGRTAVDLVDAGARAGFLEQLGQGCHRLTEICAAAGVASGVLAVDRDPDAALTQLWRARRRRR